MLDLSFVLSIDVTVYEKLESMSEEFDSRISLLTYEDVRLLYNQHNSVELNNVLEGFENDFYTIMLYEDNSLDEYTLFYIGAYDEVKGLALRSGRNIKDRDYCTLNFAKAIEDEFPEKNCLQVFNTFQSQLTKVYENFGVLCVPEKILSLGDNLSFVMPLGSRKKEVDYILRIDILDMYKSFFNREKKVEEKESVSKVYLMYDKREGYVKIGTTKRKLNVRKKGVSEPTLRAKDPMIEVITAWEATDELEKKLHSMYSFKRIRGEWFDLRTTDMKQINHLTLDYSMIIC